MNNKISNIVIENARIGFRNFSGKEGKFNPEGRRNFCVFLEPEIANRLEKDGWNVRWLEPREPGEEKQAYLQVTVNYQFENLQPKVVIISSKGKTVLNESTISMMDWIEIKPKDSRTDDGGVDLTIRPRTWEVGGKNGVKAYLKNMFVHIVEDELESKYYDAPDSAAGSIGGCGNCDACDGSCGCHDND